MVPANMYRGQSIGVVVPARDEASLIGRTLAGIPDMVDRVLVVDDGSVDRTSAVVRTLAPLDRRVTLVVHRRPIGVGGAILRGYRDLQRAGCDLIAVMAGDDQMDPGDLPALLDPICSGRSDFAKGDRFAHPAVWRTMPKDRLLGNLLLTWVTRRVSGYAGLRDAQCGYTVVRAALVPEILAAGLHPGYGFPNALLAWLRVLGARVEQVPVRPIYAGEQSGLSVATVTRIYPGVLWRAWRMRRRGAPAPGPPKPGPVEAEEEVRALASRAV